MYSRNKSTRSKYTWTTKKQRIWIGVQIFYPLGEIKIYRFDLYVHVYYFVHSILYFRVIYKSIQCLGGGFKGGDFISFLSTQQSVEVCVGGLM
jgi:hypothetical protein